MDMLSPEQFEKISRWSWRKIFFYFVFIFILSGGILKAYKYFSGNTIQATSSISQENRTSINNNVNTTIPTVKGDSVSKDNGAPVEKEFDEKDWQIDYNRINKISNQNGHSGSVFCVKDSRKFDSAIIWYKEKIPLGTTLRLRYAMENASSMVANTPKLIFAYGDESDFRIFLPEDAENKFIGIEKINSDKSKSRNHIRLISRIDSYKENVFEITVKNSSVNKASFIYNLKYFPLLDEDVADDKPAADGDSFVEYLPWIDPGNIGFRQLAGVGAFNNTCIRIVSATWLSAESNN